MDSDDEMLEDKIPPLIRRPKTIDPFSSQHLSKDIESEGRITTSSSMDSYYSSDPEDGGDISRNEKTSARKLIYGPELRNKEHVALDITSDDTDLFSGLGGHVGDPAELNGPGVKSADKVDTKDSTSKSDVPAGKNSAAVMQSRPVSFFRGIMSKLKSKIGGSGSNGGAEGSSSELMNNTVTGDNDLETGDLQTPLLENAPNPDDRYDKVIVFTEFERNEMEMFEKRKGLFYKEKWQYEKLAESYVLSVVSALGLLAAIYGSNIIGVLMAKGLLNDKDRKYVKIFACISVCFLIGGVAYFIINKFLDLSKFVKDMNQRHKTFLKSVEKFIRRVRTTHQANVSVAAVVYKTPSPPVYRPPTPGTIDVLYGAEIRQMSTAYRFSFIRDRSIDGHFLVHYWVSIILTGTFGVIGLVMFCSFAAGLF